MCSQLTLPRRTKGPRCSSRASSARERRDIPIRLRQRPSLVSASGAWRRLYLSNGGSDTLLMQQIRCRNPSQNASRGVQWTTSGFRCAQPPPLHATGQICGRAAQPAATTMFKRCSVLCNPPHSLPLSGHQRTWRFGNRQFPGFSLAEWKWLCDWLRTLPPSPGRAARLHRAGPSRPHVLRASSPCRGATCL